MYCYLSCLSSDKHSKLTRLIYCPITLLYLGTVRLVPSRRRRSFLCVCSQSSLKHPSLVLYTHYICTWIRDMLWLWVICGISVTICLVIWYFYKSSYTQVNVSFPLISPYQNRVKGRAQLWLTSCGGCWFTQTALMLNHYMLAQSILAWLKRCHCPCKCIFGEYSFYKR